MKTTLTHFPTWLLAAYLFGLFSAAESRADLVGWWSFDDDASDSSGNDLDSVEIGNPELDDAVPVAVGSGRSLRVVIDGVSVDDAAIDLDVFTLGYFVNQDGVTQGDAGLQRLTSRAGDAFETAIGDANALGGTASATGTTLSYFQGGWNVTDVEIPEDGWVHVAWQNTEDDMLLYIDGNLEYTGPAVDPGRAVGFMNIGIRHNDIEGFEGLMDDVFLWDDSENALTEDDIARIASGGISGFLGEDTDTDEDGLPDRWEDANGLDPEDDGSGDVKNGPDGDGDADGLNNLQEFELRTDPNKDDTDDDGLKDNVETNTGTWIDTNNTGTNPANSDSDGDGLNDSVETNTGTFVSATDTGTSPHEADTDGSGGSDGQEVEKGTDPTDPNDPAVAEVGLVLHLPFDGSLTDESGQAHDGEALGDDDPVFVDNVSDIPRAGNAISFNGDGTENQGVMVEGTEALAPDDFTLAYWIKPAEEQGNAGLERLTSRGGDQFETAIGDANAVGGGDGPLTLSYFQGGWNVTTATVEADQWTHVAWRNNVDDDVVEVFVNGENVFEGPAVPAGRVATGSVLHIGTRHNNVEGYEGLMDDLRLYETMLSDEQILELATPPNGPPDQIISVRRTLVPAAQATITWESRPGASYSLEFSTDLTEGSWLELDDGISSVGEETSFIDNNATVDEPVRYYRVRRN